MRNTVAAPREGPGGLGLPLSFRPKWGPKGRKKNFFEAATPTTPANFVAAVTKWDKILKNNYKLYGNHNCRLEDLHVQG